MFKKLKKKIIKSSLVELNPKGYYIIFVEKDEDVPELAEAFTRFTEEIGGPKAIIMSKESFSRMRVIEIE